MNAREQAEAGAADWIARRERDDWSGADEAALDAWISESTDHRVAWLRLHAAWEKTHRLKALLTDAAPGRVPSPEEIRLPFFHAGATRKRSGEAESGSPRQPATKRYAALAASAVIVVGAVVVWQSMRGPGYHTGVGAMQSVPLADGSRVTLNTSTDLRVIVTPTERRVSLERGEAFFQVAKDPARPFVVDAGSRRVVAVGTEFSVRREGGEVRVLVMEGSVRLEAAGADPSAAPGAGRQGEPLLAAGSIARAESDSVLVREKAVVEVEQLLSWRSGFLVFDGTPLAEAVAEFNRYNRRQVVIDDPRIGAVPVGGNFRATNVDAFVRLIASDLSITATRQGNTIILSAKRPG